VLRQAAQQVPTWDYEDETQVLSDAQIDHIISHAVSASSPNNPYVAAWIALLWGQRLGDVIKLCPHNVALINDGLVASGRVAATFSLTKTSRTSGAYTLTAPLHSIVGQLLAKVSSPFPHDTAANLKHLLPFKMDVRALRRTGLIRLALSGIKMEELLSFSRHASIKMLETYLYRGAFNIPLARAQTQASKMVETIRMPAITPIA
jgi:integrase